MEGFVQILNKFTLGSFLGAPRSHTRHACPFPRIKYAASRKWDMSLSSSTSNKTQCAACERAGGGENKCGFCIEKAKRLPNTDGSSDAASVASTKRARECHYCHSEGHVVRVCPKRQAAEQARQARAELECFYCKQKGHMVAECAERRKWEAERECFFCGRRGHMVADCAKAARARAPAKATGKQDSKVVPLTNHRLMVRWLGQA